MRQPCGGVTQQLEFQIPGLTSSLAQHGTHMHQHRRTQQTFVSFLCCMQPPVMLLLLVPLLAHRCAIAVAYCCAVLVTMRLQPAMHCWCSLSYVIHGSSLSSAHLAYCCGGCWCCRCPGIEQLVTATPCGGSQWRDGHCHGACKTG